LPEPIAALPPARTESNVAADQIETLHALTTSLAGTFQSYLLLMNIGGFFALVATAPFYAEVSGGPANQWRYYPIIAIRGSVLMIGVDLYGARVASDCRDIVASLPFRRVNEHQNRGSSAESITVAVVTNDSIPPNRSNDDLIRLMEWQLLHSH